MESFRKYLLPLLILLILVGLAIGFRDFFFAYVIQPVALLFWAAWRIALSIDQRVYWTLVLVFCVLLAINFLLSRNDDTPRSAFNEKRQVLNRIEYWQSLMSESSLGKQESEQLRESLKTLLDTVANSEAINSEGILSEWREPLSFEAKDYLFPPQKKPNNLRVSILELLPGWFRKAVGNFTHRDEAVIDEILHWMEMEMEIDNEK